MNKIINIWKPIGWTSFDVVKKVKNLVRPYKVGHAGTLDPFAEGVLVICIGKMTKKVESLMNHEKEYIATIELGIETDTLDTEGSVIKKCNVNRLSDSKIKLLLENFKGESSQVPPMYSALRVNGKRLYEIAREGKTVDRKPRKIFINEIKLLGQKNNLLKIKVRCGRGTYIRVLGSDIAKSMNTVGHLKSLERTRVGDFKKEDSLNIKDIDKWLFAQV